MTKRWMLGWVCAGVLSLTACGANPTPTPTLPTLIPTLLPSLTPSSEAQVQAAVEGTLTALAPIPTFAPDFTLSPEATLPVTQLPAVTGVETIPPLDIGLPAGWQARYNAQILPDVDSNLTAFPYAAYAGPITGGTGIITLYWGFPSFTQLSDTDMAAAMLGTPVGSSPVEPDLFNDGVRILRLAVVEQGCNIGIDVRRSYRVGNLSAVGTQFSAVTCPELPDTRGWFAGVQQEGINYIFYVFSDPISAMDSSSAELQAILDTIRFRPVPTLAPTAAP